MWPRPVSRGVKFGLEAGKIDNLLQCGRGEFSRGVANLKLPSKHVKGQLKCGRG
jgi:hypothetical protein